jgi:hypothetical protein
VNPGASAKSRALLELRRAWSQAVAGDSRSAAYSLDTARRILAADDSAPAPHWSSWVDSTELDIMTDEFGLYSTIRDARSRRSNAPWLPILITGQGTRRFTRHGLPTLTSTLGTVSRQTRSRNQRSSWRLASPLSGHSLVYGRFPDGLLILGLPQVAA